MKYSQIAKVLEQVEYHKSWELEEILGKKLTFKLWWFGRIDIWGDSLEIKTPVIAVPGRSEISIKKLSGVTVGTPLGTVLRMWTSFWVKMEVY